MRPDIRDLIAATGLFSIGYSTLIFTIPLFAVAVGSSESGLGFIALVYTIPSLFIPFAVGKLLDKAKSIRVIQVVRAAYTLLILLFPYGSNFLQVVGIRPFRGFWNCVLDRHGEKAGTLLIHEEETRRDMILSLIGKLAYRISS